MIFILAAILKNSLSSSRDSTPTVIKISRGATPTPLLQSVIQKPSVTDESTISLDNNKNEAITKDSTIIKSAMEIFKEKDIFSNKVGSFLYIFFSIFSRESISKYLNKLN